MTRTVLNNEDEPPTFSPVPSRPGVAVDQTEPRRFGRKRETLGDSDPFSFSALSNICREFRL